MKGGSCGLILLCRWLRCFIQLQIIGHVDKGRYSPTEFRMCRRGYREYAVSLDQDDMGSNYRKRIIKWDIEIQSLRGRTPRLQQRSLICTLSTYTQVYKTAQVSTAPLPRYVFRGRDACFARRRIRNQNQNYASDISTSSLSFACFASSMPCLKADFFESTSSRLRSLIQVLLRTSFS
jgi:hypothetical protein